MRYAIIENNVVTNVIVSEQDFIDVHYPNAVLLKDEDKVGPYYIYDNGTFSEPIYEEIIDAEIVQAAIEN